MDKIPPRVTKTAYDLKGDKELIEFLNKEKSNKIICEVGCLLGELTLEFAKIAEEVHAIDSFESEYDVTDPFSFYDMDLVANEFYNNIEDSKYNEKIYVYEDYSSKVVNNFEGAFFDYVHIDANHQYDFVLEDIILWSPKIKPTGYIGGSKYDDKKYNGIFKAVNEVFGSDKVKLFSNNNWIVKI